MLNNLLIIIIIAFFQFHLVINIEPFTIHYLSEYKDSKCLDGSPPAYYYSKASSRDGQKKFVIHINGGGWCGEGFLKTTPDYILESCLSRSQSYFGSSNYLDKVVNDKIGIMSGDKYFNPYFYDWNRLDLHYCDGTFQQGYKRLPITVQGKQIWFRGMNNTISFFYELISKFNLTNAEEVLLVGSSSGGFSALMWTNYLRDLLPKKVRMWTIADSSFFPDYLDTEQNDYLFRKNIISIMSIVNEEVEPVAKECIAHNNNFKWKCFFLNYLIRYSKVPVFIVQAFQDLYIVVDIYKEKCLLNGLSSCSKSSLNKINKLSENLKLEIIDCQNAANQSVGFWLLQGTQHCLVASLYSFQNISKTTIPSNTDNTIAFSMYKWMYGIQDYYNWSYIDLKKRKGSC